LFLRAEHVVKDGSGKILLKEDGKTTGAFAFGDAIGIVVAIVQN
jgi:hypothetical protein